MRVYASVQDVFEGELVREALMSSYFSEDKLPVLRLDPRLFQVFESVRGHLDFVHFLRNEAAQRAQFGLEGAVLRVLQNEE